MVSPHEDGVENRDPIKFLFYGRLAIKRENMK
jgi:hypothetical protein